MEKSTNKAYKSLEYVQLKLRENYPSASLKNKANLFDPLL